MSKRITPKVTAAEKAGIIQGRHGLVGAIAAAIIGAAALIGVNRWPKQEETPARATVSVPASGNELATQPTVSSPTPEIAGPFASLDGYIDENGALEGRFYEQQVFQKSAVGRVVKWTLRVESIRDSPMPSGPGVVLIGASPMGRSRYAFAYFPGAWGTRLYALQLGDVVEVTGTLSDGTRWPSLTATALRVVRVPASLPSSPATLPSPTL